MFDFKELKTKNVSITVRVEENIKDILNEIAKENHTKISAVVQIAIKDWIALYRQRENEE